MYKKTFRLLELAKIVGVKPNTIKLYFQNFQLQKYIVRICRGVHDWEIEASAITIQDLYKFLDKKGKYRYMGKLEKAYPNFLTKKFLENYRKEVWK